MEANHLTITSDFLKFFKSKYLLSNRQLGIICGYSDQIVKDILDTGFMTPRQYNNIYARLDKDIDELHSEFMKCGLK